MCNNFVWTTIESEKLNLYKAHVPPEISKPPNTVKDCSTTVS